MAFCSIQGMARATAASTAASLGTVLKVES